MELLGNNCERNRISIKDMDNYISEFLSSSLAGPIDENSVILICDSLLNSYDDKYLLSKQVIAFVLLLDDKTEFCDVTRNYLSELKYKIIRLAVLGGTNYRENLFVESLQNASSEQNAPATRVCGTVSGDDETRVIERVVFNDELGRDHFQKLLIDRDGVVLDVLDDRYEPTYSDLSEQKYAELLANMGGVGHDGEC